MYCQECGKDIGETDYCEDCDIEYYDEESIEKSKDPKSSINARVKIIIYLLVAILLFLTNPPVKRHASLLFNTNNPFIHNEIEVVLRFRGIEYYDLVLVSFLVRKKDNFLLTVGVLGIVIPLGEVD